MGFSYEQHAFIKYEKIGIFYDHKFNERLLRVFHLERFDTRAGVEFSMIKRKDEYTSDHRPITTSLVLYGFNLGTYYNVRYRKQDTGLDIGINLNVFRGETEYQKWKHTYLEEFRVDFMVVIIRRFNINKNK